VQRLRACDYDAIYMRVLVTDTDPAGNMDYWVSSGEGHFWNIASEKPATEWEARIDALMQEQARTIDMDKRRELFNQVQRIMAENAPALFFAVPRLYAAHSTRVQGAVPSVIRPNLLWNVDMLSVSAPAAR